MVTPRTGTQRTDISGLSFVSGQIKTTAAGGGGGVASDVSVKGVHVTASALAVNATFSGVTAAKVTASTDLPISLNNVSGQVPVTAGNVPLPVSAAGVKVSSESLQVFVGGTPNVNLVDVSGEVPVTAGGAPLPVTAAGGWPAIRGDAIYNAQTSNPVKYATIDHAAAACANVISSVAGRKIRVLAYDIITAGTVQATWCGTSPYTEFGGGQNLARGKVAPFNPMGWFETSAGNALTLRLGGAVSAAGHVVYQEVF